MKKLVLIILILLLPIMAESGHVTILSGGVPVAGDTTSPTLTSSTIAANGTTLTFLFSETVSIGAGGNGGWTITPSYAAATLAYTSGSGSSSLVYTISRAIYSNETATVAYTQPGNGVEDTSGNDLATIVSAAVTNNSTAGWSDNFDGGTGDITGRTGWSAHTYAYDSGTARDTAHACTNNEIQRTENLAENQYNLATYTPVDANYSVQVNVKIASVQSGSRILTPVVRGYPTAITNTLNGYIPRIVPATTATIGIRRIDNGAMSTIGTDTTLGSITWTNYNTIKLDISGTGSSAVLTLYVNGNQVHQVTDNSVPTGLQTKNNAAILSHVDTSDITQYLDNFVITD